MTQVTPTYGFPYPELTDPPNGPAQFQALALAVENKIIITDKKPSNIVFSSSGSLAAATVTGAKALRVRVWGAGGGSGGCAAPSAAQAAASSGGGGGAYAESILDIATVSFPVTITVGGGGAGGGAGATNGVAGGDSSFAAQVIAKGGGAGNGGAVVAAGGVSSSNAAGGSAAASTGNIVLSGQSGTNGIAVSIGALIVGVGGASGAGNFSVNKPNVGNGTAAGVAGSGFGAGAHGAVAVASGAAQAGAAGAGGGVIVEPIY
jgi:hypothetical protein